MKFRIPVRLAVLTVLLMSMAVTAVSAADCGGSHTWGDGQILWNEDYTAALGKWSCTSCEETKTAEAFLTFDRTEPTCSELGSYVVNAHASLDRDHLCSASHEIGLARLAHVYSEPQFLWDTVDFMCQAYLVCTICDETDIEDCNITKSTYPADGHTPGGTIYVAYTNVGGETYTDTRKVAGDPIGHDYSTPVFIWSEDYLSARAESICSICKPGDAARVISDECTVNRREEPADCFSDGYRECVAYADLLDRTWTETKTIVLSKLEHTYTYPKFSWKNDGICVATYSCTVCGETYVNDCEITEKEEYSDCTSPGKLTLTANITIDGYTYRSIYPIKKEISAKGHKCNIVPGKEPTCTENGLTDSMVCTVCKKTVQEHTEIPALGHTEVAIVGTEATCTEEGMTDYVFCAACEKVLQIATVIPAIGHTPEIISGYEPTCKEDGRGDCEICTVCEVVLIEPKRIPALGHTSLKLEAREATCTENGYSAGEICSVCNDILLKQTIFYAKGHAKEIQKGYAATCTEEGLTDGEVCTVCYEVIKEQKVIPAKGHTPEKEDIRPATCTEPGYSEGNTCTVCKEAFLQPGVIPPKGHTPKIIEGKAATCTEDGITDGSICSVCQTVLEESEILPALKHQWQRAVFTWNEACDSAQAEKVCSVCNIVLSAKASVSQTERPVGGTTVTVFTATADFSDGTAATDEKLIVPDTVLPGQETPEVPPADSTYPNPEPEPNPKPEPNPEPNPDPEPEAVVPQFNDVASDSYYYDAVVWAAKTQITQGTADRVFSSDMICSRAQIVTMLWRAAGAPILAGETAFTDVPAEAYYYRAVLWATENGITAGTLQTSFSPDLQCTRSQIVTMLWRAAGCPTVDTVSVFFDVAADAWYADAVKWAVSEGITVGTGRGIFSPDAVCTRAQIVTFLFRARNLW